VPPMPKILSSLVLMLVLRILSITLLLVIPPLPLVVLLALVVLAIVLLLVEELSTLLLLKPISAMFYISTVSTIPILSLPLPPLVVKSASAPLHQKQFYILNQPILASLLVAPPYKPDTNKALLETLVI